MNRGTILFRVDGSAQQGMGRVARSLALANALQRRRYQMTFISQLDPGGWPDRIRRHRHAIVRTPHSAGSDADHVEFLREVETRSPLVVITDSPAYDEQFLAQLSHRVPLVITIDDDAKRRTPSDIILNPMLVHTSADYDLYPGCQVLAGERYAMVRSEFRRARQVRATEPGGGTRILLALGGGEVGLDTARLAEAFLAEKSIDRVDAVIGSSTQGRAELKSLIEQHPGRIGLTTDARDLAARVTKSHLLVTGAGNTPMEAACVGIPTIVLPRRPEHYANAERLEEVGVAQNLGPAHEVKADAVVKSAMEILGDNFERKAMSRSGRMLIDGRGGDRLVTATEILLRRSVRKTKTTRLAA